jgi:hypothetical protein
METEARAKVVEIIEEDDLIEADFVEIAKEQMRANVQVLALGDP